jgi:hypothetical protein
MLVPLLGQRLDDGFRLIDQMPIQGRLQPGQQLLHDAPMQIARQIANGDRIGIHQVPIVPRLERLEHPLKPAPTRKFPHQLKQELGVVLGPRNEAYALAVDVFEDVVVGVVEVVDVVAGR